MLTTIGLTLIVIGWIVQFSSVLQSGREISRFFVILYTLGVLLLVIDGYMNKQTTMASLNLISLLLAGFIVFKLKKEE